MTTKLKLLSISEFEMSYITAVRLADVCDLKMERKPCGNKYQYHFTAYKFSEAAIELIADECFHGRSAINIE